LHDVAGEFGEALVGFGAGADEVEKIVGRCAEGTFADADACRDLG